MRKNNVNRMKKNNFNWKGALGLCLLILLVSGCGGGGGGGGNSAAPGADSFPETLDFSSPDTFVNGRDFKTTNTVTRLSGGLHSAFTPTRDCNISSNFNPSRIMELRWQNTANNQSGQADIVIVCTNVPGGLTGVKTFWETDLFNLEMGENNITLDTYENGKQIGRNSVTIVRERASITVGSQVITNQGTLQGVIEGNLSVFRGIRFAAAPVGELRFKAPESPPSFSGIADATQFGPTCLQPAGSGSTGEEDCLFLNIWTHNDSTVRPVIVFLHGGSANGVSGSSPALEGSALASNGDTIVVTLNRRLDALGFLALDELIQENPRATAGNYGVLDVIAALQWIQQNITAFNGDPQKVMLAGESAGGAIICHILAAPEAAGLFQSVAIQSGGCGGRTILNSQVINEPTPFPPAVESHRPILAETGCDTAADVLECLRALPADEVVAAANSVPRVGGNRSPFTATIDGVVVQSNPYTALANELVGDIPLLVGSNRDEMNTILNNISLPDDSAYRSLLSSLFTDPLDDQLYAIYPTSDFPSPEDAFRTLMGELAFNCVAEELARNAAGGSATSYLYQLTRGFDSGTWAGLGAVHFIDVLYLFETFDELGYIPDTQAMNISMAMQEAWVGLARSPTQAPPLAGSDWPSFNSNNILVAEFGDTIAETAGHREGRCTQLRDLNVL